MVYMRTRKAQKKDSEKLREKQSNHRQFTNPVLGNVVYVSRYSYKMFPTDSKEAKSLRGMIWWESDP